MNIIEGYENYLINNDDEEYVSFSEWFNVLMEKADYLDKEQEVIDEFNEDMDYLDGYYTALNEELTVKIKNKKNNNDNKLNSEELKNKYLKYKKKREKSGKEVLSFYDWVEAQNLAKEAKSTLKKAGITLAGTTALAIGTSLAKGAAKKIENKMGVNSDNKSTKKTKTTYNHVGKKSKTRITVEREYH